MRPDKTDVWKARHGSGLQQAHDCARRVEHEFDAATLGVGERRLRGAGRAERMAEDKRLAPVQLFYQWGESGVAQIFALIAGKDADAIGFQHIEHLMPRFASPQVLDPSAPFGVPLLWVYERVAGARLRKHGERLSRHRRRTRTPSPAPPSSSDIRTRTAA